MKTKRTIITLTVAVAALVGGTVGGAAAAQVPAVLAPWGVSGDSDDTAKMPVPEYDENASGLTYGSAAEAPTPDLEPDLIQAQATNGAVGYVRKTELDKANGSAAVETFNSPEEALAWQAKQGTAPIAVPVYAIDGYTVIGELLVTRDR